MGDDSSVALEAPRGDEGKLKGHVNEVVRSSVEATLNGYWTRKRIRFVRRSAMSVRRIGSIAGPHYEPKLDTHAGEVTLRVPKLRSLPFETAIIERYRRRESSVEEALVEMYLARHRCDESKTSRRRCGARG